MRDAHLLYAEGYQQAIRDVAGWINQPGKPLERPLMKPVHLERVLCFIAEHSDEFSSAPELFELNYQVDKKRLTLWR